MDDYYIVYDKPYEYKKIKIYPVLVENYLEFNSCITCLLLQKNKTQDVKIIKMSYLDWLFWIQDQDVKNKIFLEMLDYLFQLILQEQNFQFFKDSNGKISFVINDNQFNSKDFVEIKNIICKQNNIDGSEIILDDDLEKALIEAQEYHEKHNIKLANFEELMIAYHIYTGLDYEKIHKLPIRKFNKGIERIQLLENYRIAKTAEMSGMVKFKEEIKYWLSHVERKGRFDHLLIKDANKKIGELKQMLN